MIKEINGKTWFCCPVCGQKIHPVRPGAQGVFAMCKGKKPDGGRCNWAGEIRWGGFIEVSDSLIEEANQELERRADQTMDRLFAKLNNQ